jgi:hypothetical protein
VNRPSTGACSTAPTACSVSAAITAVNWTNLASSGWSPANASMMPSTSDCSFHDRM